MKLLGVFLSKSVEGVSVCVSLWLSECVQICAMYDLSGPKLWLWPGESSRLVQKKSLSTPCSTQPSVCLKFIVFSSLWEKK